MTATQQQRSSKALLEQSPPRSWVNGPTKLMLSPRSICSLTSFSSRPVSIQISSICGFFFSPLWMCGGTLPTTPGMSPDLACTTTGEPHHQPAVNAARLADPQKAALLDVGDDQTDLVDVRVEQQVRTALLRGNRYTYRLLWTVRWQAPKPSQSCSATASAFSSAPETPFA